LIFRTFDKNQSMVNGGTSDPQLLKAPHLLSSFVRVNQGWVAAA